MYPATNRVLANTVGIEPPGISSAGRNEGSCPGKIESITMETETNFSDSLELCLFFLLGHAIRSQPIDINEGHFLKMTEKSYDKPDF